MLSAIKPDPTPSALTGVADSGHTASSKLDKSRFCRIVSGRRALMQRKLVYSISLIRRWLLREPLNRSSFVLRSYRRRCWVMLVSLTDRHLLFEIHESNQQQFDGGSERRCYNSTDRCRTAIRALAREHVLQCRPFVCVSTVRRSGCGAPAAVVPGYLMLAVYCTTVGALFIS